jgi:hypothetical protein
VQIFAVNDWLLALATNFIYWALRDKYNHWPENSAASVDI